MLVSGGRNMIAGAIQMPFLGGGNLGIGATGGSDPAKPLCLIAPPSQHNGTDQPGSSYVLN